jgi:shikimate dehydrogenase
LIKAAVLGSPISHSLSPQLHSLAYEFLGIKGSYTSFDVPAGTLKDFLQDKLRDWTGFSLTMPLKEEAITCASFIDPLAKKISSGNTLINENGSWKLFSTDVMGFQKAWQFHNSSQPKSILIIGSGATARAAAAAFDSTGSFIQILHRSPEREESIRGSVENSQLDFLPWMYTDQILNCDLVINTTPKFALDQFASQIREEPLGIFFDVIYDPWPTEFAKAWMKSGARIISGLELLISQGIEQIRMFTGSEFSTDDLNRFLRNKFRI